MEYPQQRLHLRFVRQLLPEQHLQQRQQQPKVNFYRNANNYTIAIHSDHHPQLERQPHRPPSLYPACCNVIRLPSVPMSYVPHCSITSNKCCTITICSDSIITRNCNSCSSSSCNSTKCSSLYAKPIMWTSSPEMVAATRQPQRHSSSSSNRYRMVRRQQVFQLHRL